MKDGSSGRLSAIDIMQMFSPSEIEDEEKNEPNINRLSHSSLSRKERGNAIGSAMKYTIFPENKWVKRWDILIILELIILLFILPFQLGVSSSVLLDFYRFPGWASFNVFINACFVVDTFLYFFRAYQDPKTGRIVIRLDKIRRRYFHRYFIPNLISCFPTVSILGLSSQENTRTLLLFLILGLLKFIRFSRFKTIIQSSDVVNDVQDRFNAAILRFIKVCIAMGVVAHWFACTWSFVAYVETKFNFTAEGITSNANWINNWYQNNYIEGGINPLGEENFMDRYVLSLFWSVQTITSIGYGNITPVTKSEWWVASVIQLLAGFSWAFLIGAIVSSVDAMEVRDSDFRARIDQAQQLTQAFSDNKAITRYRKKKQKKMNGNRQSNFIIDDDPLFAMGLNENNAKRRIMRYIHSQRRRGDGNSFQSTCVDRFPVLKTLTPQLYRTACYCLLRTELENVPYLSSRYLSVSQQGQIAEKCVFLEFAAGETFMSRQYEFPGPGIFVFESGCALAALLRNGRRPLVSVVTSGIDVHIQDFVLLDPDFPLMPSVNFYFMTFSKVVFIPSGSIRDVMMKVNHPAWNECGRWRYLRALLLLNKDIKKLVKPPIIRPVSPSKPKKITKKSQFDMLE